jgi:hypothetical protein
VAQCRRERSNTPLQALNLLNDPVFVEAGAALAYRVLLEQRGVRDRIAAMFEHALGRQPTTSESRRFIASLDQFKTAYATDAEAARQLAPAELPGVTLSEAAAWVNVATVLLNLDEFITRE